MDNEKKKLINTRRNGEIDIIRFLLSVCIVGFHYYLIVDRDFALFRKGYYAVEFFFIVCGFFLAQHADKEDSRKNGEDGSIKELWIYYVKRVTDIFNNYLIIPACQTKLKIGYRSRKCDSKQATVGQLKLFFNNK